MPTVGDDDQTRAWLDLLGLHSPRVLLADGDDERVVTAAQWLAENSPVKPVLVCTPSATSAASTFGLEVTTAPVLSQDPGVETRLRRRPDGSSRAEAEFEQMAEDPLNVCAAHVAAGRSDACVAGATRTTGDVIRAGIKVIGLEAGVSTVSSSFLMILRDGRRLAYGDCAVLPRPDERQLADVAVATARTFRELTGEDPIVAMLSFSTKGSAQHEEIELVRAATSIARQIDPGLAIDGELQLDAAIVRSVGRAKASGSEVAGRANVLIFPNLAAGNIGYKITERLAGGMAIGPILQGLAAPMNDLSRGCSSDDVVAMALLSAVQFVKRQRAGTVSA